MNILINTNPQDNIDTTKFDSSIVLNEQYSNSNNVLCFIPNRVINSKSNENICFINYGPKYWEYKQNARAIGHHLTDDKFTRVDTYFSYKIHDKIGLQHDEEVDVSLLAIELCLQQNHEVTLSKKISLKPKEEEYLNNLITENKIKILNE